MHRFVSILIVLTGCASDPGSNGSGTGLSSSSDGTGVPGTASTADESEEASSAGLDASETAGGSTTTDPTTAQTTDTAGSTGTSGSTGEPPPEVPGGVFLWIGSGGGGPGTDLYPDSVEAVFVDAGVDVEMAEMLPADFEERFGTLVYLNPRDDFDPAVDAAAIDLVERGGRLVLVMEHCKNGCWGNADGHNALLGALRSGLTIHGDGGAPPSDTSLDVAPISPLTDGVGELVVYYSGHVEVGTGEGLGTIAGGDVVVGYERLGWGEVLAIADSSMFGYRLDNGDNRQFVANFAPTP